MITTTTHHSPAKTPAEIAGDDARAFFALLDSGKRAEAMRHYDTLSPPARRNVENEDIARCERRCPQM